MRVLVCGDRNWCDRKALYNTLDLYHNSTPLVIIEGKARGADTMAGEWAIERGAELLEFPADWDGTLGLRGSAPRNAAGPIRNKQMLDEGKPEIVFAFHNDLSNSSGTKDMVAKAKHAGLPVNHYFNVLRVKKL